MDFTIDTMTRYGVSRAFIATGLPHTRPTTAALLLTHHNLLTAAIPIKPLSPFRNDPLIRN
jgi:hypothetical protein